MIEKKIKSFSAGAMNFGDLSFFVNIEHLKDKKWEEHNQMNEDDQMYPILLDVKLLNKSLVIISHQSNYIVDDWVSIKNVVMTKFLGSEHLNKFDYFTVDQIEKMMTELLDAEFVRNKYIQGLDDYNNIH